jgi:serine phosphatase RsbU (regulator of sigma subunit)
VDYVDQFTRGVDALQAGQQREAERVFERLVRDNQTLPAPQLVALLKAEIAGFYRGSHPDDDVTILILERKLG